MTPHTTPIRVAVFDIDGTLALLDKTTDRFTALPGAVAAIAACRAAGIVPFAYTNGTFFPPEHYYPKLAEAGLLFDPGHILTPAVVAAHAMVDMGITRAMVMGGDGTVLPARAAGLEVLPVTRAAAETAEAVLLGYTRDLSTEALETVVQAVWNGARPFAGSVAPFFAGPGGGSWGYPAPWRR